MHLRVFFIFLLHPKSEIGPCCNREFDKILRSMEVVRSEVILFKTFAVKWNLEQADTFTESGLKQAMEEGISLETDFKTGRLAEQIAVELLIVRYSGAI